MADGQKPDRGPRIKLANMEKILPEIKKELADEESHRAECAEIESRMPELKKEFFDTERKYTQLKDEIEKTNKKLVNKYLNSGSVFVRRCREIQQMWRVSKTPFFIVAILITMLVLYTIFSFSEEQLWGTLSLEYGAILIGVILFVGFSKYRIFSGFLILTMAFFIGSNFVSDETVRWAFFTAGLAVFSLGVTLQTFISGEIVEKKLDEVLKRLPESPDTETKPEEKK